MQRFSNDTLYLNQTIKIMFFVVVYSRCEIFYTYSFCKEAYPRVAQREFILQARINNLKTCNIPLVQDGSIHLKRHENNS